MKDILNFIYSSKTTVVLLVFLAVAMGTATFIEDQYDTQTAKHLVYNAKWFEFTLILLALNFIGHIKKHNMFRWGKAGGLLFHLSFIVMIIGAGITRYFGFEGDMHIREGESSNIIYSSETYLLVNYSDGNNNISHEILLSGGNRFFNSFPVSLPAGEKTSIDINFNKYISNAGESKTDAILLNISSGGKNRTDTVISGSGFIAEFQDHIFEGKTIGFGFGKKPIELPFSIHLNDFILERYPGSDSPSSYASEVTLTDNRSSLKQDHRIFMNNVLDYDNFRFFQSSYDRDEMGTILSVNHDFWGTWISYSGYFLLTIGCMITLFTGSSRFLSLRRNIAEVRKARKAGTLAISLIFCMNVFSTPQGQIFQPVSTVQAENFGKIISQSMEGRFEPVHSLAYDILHKISRKDEFNFEGKGKMDAMRVFLDMMIDPQFWQQQKLIYIREQSVRDVIGITGTHASIADFFDGGNKYKIQGFVETAFRKKQSEQSVFDKEIIKVDERVNIFLMSIKGSILKIFPEQGSNVNKWVSWNERPAFVPLTGVVNLIKEDMGLETLNYTNIMGAYFNELQHGIQSGDYSRADKILGYISGIQKQGSNAALLPSGSRINAEVFYNKAQIFIQLKNCYAILSLLLLLLAFIDNVKTKKNKIIGLALNILTFLLGIAFLYHTLGMGLRWYITGHAPWSNGYEALVLVAWGSLLAGFSIARHSKITLAATALLAFFTMMTASHSNYDPQLTNLAPVLKSYWLIIHVAVLTVSYGFLGLGFILGIMNLFICLFKTGKNKNRLDLLITELTYINEMNLTVGIVLATIGTFLGGVWANESWGRYWGWDAKETWALIITITYTVILHLRLVPKLKGNYFFNVASILGFSSVLMTFFGVNYYLSKGMHSYASGDTPVFPLWAWGIILSVITLIVVSGVKEYSSRNSQNSGKIYPEG